MGGDNDGTQTAQPLPDGVVAGGAAGPDDGTLTEDDHRLSDFYRIARDDRPRTADLLITDPAVADLDLLVVDEDGTLLGTSLETGERERVDIPAGTGVAFVIVATHLPTSSGTSSYQLTLTASADAAGVIEVDAGDLVAGEMIVRFREGAITAAATFEVAGAQAARAHGTPRARGGALYRLRRSAAGGPARDTRQDTLDAVAAMRRRPDVLWAQPNYRRQPSRVPNDEFFAFQWHYPRIALPAAWDVTVGSPEVIVAVIDTGLLIGHPDIAAERLVPGFDFISDPDTARDGDGIDDDPFDVGDGDPGVPSTFHGTHVAGTIGAATDNGTGVAGVDWRAKIMPIRALGAGGGSDFDIAQGIRFSAGLPNVSGTLPARRADVINMSLGGAGVSPAMREAIQDARAAGVMVVVAAGNENADAAGFSPAGFPEVVCVSAVDARAAKASYSNFGTVVDVAAPGGDTSIDRDGDGFVDGVLSTRGQDDNPPEILAIFDFLQGTSMASPHVAGVVALMQAAYMDTHGGRRMTPDELDVLLRRGALTDALGPDDFSGHGLINAHKAVLAARDLDAPGDGGPDSPVARGDEGHVSIRLVDIETGSVIARSESDRARDYAFTFDAVAPGTYRVEAGTDRDGDAAIDDRGEAFGAGTVDVLGGRDAQVTIPVGPTDLD
jgi:serine protease